MKNTTTHGRGQGASGIFAAAEANWPEDEAYHFATYLRELAEDGEDAAYLADYREKQIAHWQRVFSCQPDSEDLFSRFMLELSKQEAA